MTAQSHGHEALPGLDVEALAGRILSVFPKLEPDARRVSLP